MKWKRGVHAEHGTRLVESTWAEVMFGDGLAKLEAELRGLGLTFDWNPDRPIKNQWAKPMKDEDLARLVRTFMSHIKSNRGRQKFLNVDLLRNWRASTDFGTACSSTCTGRFTRSGRSDLKMMAASTSRTCWSRPLITSKPGGRTVHTT